MRIIEADQLRLAQHLEEQKAARRAISRRVTRVQQTLRTSGVNSQRYVDFATEDTLPLYAEEIDAQRDEQEAVILSETANALGKIARQQQNAVEQLLHGSEDDPLTDYLLKMGTVKQE